jgi:hypothetical protein
MPDESGLIATHYRIDTTRPPLALAGGLRAYKVVDQRDPAQKLMAVQTRLDLPARPRVTLARAGPDVPYAVLPVDYGTGFDPAGQQGFFVIAEALPGAAISLGRGPWREQHLIACILLPAAAALMGLQGRGLTHRAINPDNLFRDGTQEPVTLGPFWAAPPASLQPAVYEPPYMARCLPGGRGEGTIADDVYALGVTLVALAIGRTPLAELDDDTILRRKIEIGSYAALTAHTPLPPLVGDLLRSMLAEDPEHRPSPKLLLNPEQARARRVAARPARRAPAPLEVGGQAAATARELAYEAGKHPGAAYPLLKSGAVELWLRRGLGDPQTGMEVEDVVRNCADHPQPDEPKQREMMVMLCVCAIDRLAPMVWHGRAVQPDGLGSALACASQESRAALEDLIAAEALCAYIAAVPRRPDLAALRDDGRAYRRFLTLRGPAGGLNRLIYELNPMFACASPLLATRAVVRIADLLPAMEAESAVADRTRPPMDTHVAAFIAARADRALTGELAALRGLSSAAERLAVLRMFGKLEARLQPGPLPGLAAWLLQSGFATLEDWRSHKTRAALEASLKDAAAAGQIGTMLRLVDDPEARRADEEGVREAASRVRSLQAALADIKNGASRREEAARALGQEFATGAGLCGLLGAVASLALR